MKKFKKLITMFVIISMLMFIVRGNGLAANKELEAKVIDLENGKTEIKKIPNILGVGSVKNKGYNPMANKGNFRIDDKKINKIIDDDDRYETNNTEYPYSTVAYLEFNIPGKGIHRRNSIYD